MHCDVFYRYTGAIEGDDEVPFELVILLTIFMVGFRASVDDFVLVWGGNWCFIWLEKVRMASILLAGYYIYCLK